MSDTKTGRDDLLEGTDATGADALDAESRMEAPAGEAPDRDAAPTDADAPAEGATDTLAETVMRLETELADARDRELRAIADAQNTRRRAEREIADAKVYAIAKFAEDLLSVSDNLARALAALPESERAGLSEAGRNLLGGIEMTEKELHAALARHGVVTIDAAPGAGFDPNLHQAVSQVPSDHPSGAIAETYQTGWKIGDRTLRAAMVAVSAGPAN